MALITIANQADPSTPSTGDTHIFVDSADKKIKTIDDTGTVTDLTATTAAENFIDKSVDYTATNTDSVIFVDASSNTVDITLFDITTATKRLTITCINADNAVTINRGGTDTINGGTTKTLAVNETVTLLPDITNTNWRLG